MNIKRARSLALAAVMKYLAFAWPLLLLDAALEVWAGPGTGSSWRSAINSLAFVWVLCAPVAPLSLLLSRESRERAMARLCGLREGDERERAITGEAARSTFLLALSLQAVLLVMTMISVRVYRLPEVPPGEKSGMLSVGMAFSSELHLDPFGPGFGAARGGRPRLELGAPAEFQKGEIPIGGGFLLAPSAFPVLALLILLQLAAFKAFASRRYAGA